MTFLKGYLDVSTRILYWKQCFASELSPIKVIRSGFMFLSGSAIKASFPGPTGSGGSTGWLSCGIAAPIIERTPTYSIAAISNSCLAVRELHTTLVRGGRPLSHRNADLKSPCGKQEPGWDLVTKLGIYRFKYVNYPLNSNWMVPFLVFRKGIQSEIAAPA